MKFAITTTIFSVLLATTAAKSLRHSHQQIYRDCKQVCSMTSSGVLKGKCISACIKDLSSPTGKSKKSASSKTKSAKSPTAKPSSVPTKSPTTQPTKQPIGKPTRSPSAAPTPTPTRRRSLSEELAWQLRSLMDILFNNKST